MTIKPMPFIEILTLYSEGHAHLYGNNQPNDKQWISLLLKELNMEINAANYSGSKFVNLTMSDNQVYGASFSIRLSKELANKYLRECDGLLQGD